MILNTLAGGFCVVVGTLNYQLVAHGWTSGSGQACVSFNTFGVWEHIGDLIAFPIIVIVGVLVLWNTAIDLKQKKRVK